MVTAKKKQRPKTDLPPVEIVAYPRGEDTVYIEWFKVPEAFRRRGVGRPTYAQWERSLPRPFKTIRLHAADPGSGPSDEFWSALGFNYRWSRDEIDDAVAEGADERELEQEMEKRRTLFTRALRKPAPKKSRRQLDAEIAAVLSKRSH